MNQQYIKKNKNNIVVAGGEKKAGQKNVEGSSCSFALSERKFQLYCPGHILLNSSITRVGDSCGNKHAAIKWLSITLKWRQNYLWFSLNQSTKLSRIKGQA